MELILGLPPLSQFDAAARPMFDVVHRQGRPDAVQARAGPHRPERHQRPDRVRRRSGREDGLQRVRPIDDFELNEILGAPSRAPMPPCRRPCVGPSPTGRQWHRNDLGGLFTTGLGVPCHLHGRSLQARAALTPDALAFCFLIDGEEEGPRFTYADLDRAARTVAAALQDVAGPGDRALLLYAPGLEFIAAFLRLSVRRRRSGAGLPAAARPARRVAWRRWTASPPTAGRRVVLTGGAVGTFVVGSCGQVADLAAARYLVTDGLDPSQARCWREPAFDADASPSCNTPPAPRPPPRA